jgi:tRNA(Ile)-lysidine synthase TilS/MesJ
MKGHLRESHLAAPAASVSTAAATVAATGVHLDDLIEGFIEQLGHLSRVRAFTLRASGCG